MAEMNLLSHYCIEHFVHLLFDFRVFLGERVEGCWYLFLSILNDARTSLPNSDVYHIWAWICCFYRHHLLLCFHAGAHAFLLFWKMAALIGRLEILSVGWGACEVWQGVCEWWGVEDVNEACRFLAKPSQLTLVTRISLLLIPPFVIYFVHLWLDCITIIAKCLNIVQFHLSFLSFTYHIL